MLFSRGRIVVRFLLSILEFGLVLWGRRMRGGSLLVDGGCYRIDAVALGDLTPMRRFKQSRQ